MANYKLFIQKAKNFSLDVGRHFVKHKCDTRAEALTYATILSLVPLLTVLLSMLTFFDSFSQFAKPIEDFVVNHFLPNTGDTLQRYFHDFIAKALELSAISLIFVWIVAIKMIFSIEEAFDAIWAVKAKRSFMSATILYALILMILPLLLGTGWALVSYISSFSFFTYLTDMAWLKEIILSLFLFGLMVGIFFMLYTVIPHTKTPPKPAFLGAVFSSILLWLIKSVFGWYIEKFTSYDLLYGALSLIPVFLIWVYFIWFIVLLGATVSYVLQSKVYCPPQREDTESPAGHENNIQ